VASIQSVILVLSLQAIPSTSIANSYGLQISSGFERGLRGHFPGVHKYGRREMKRHSHRHRSSMANTLGLSPCKVAYNINKCQCPLEISGPIYDFLFPILFTTFLSFCQSPLIHFPFFFSFPAFSCLRPFLFVLSFSIMDLYFIHSVCSPFPRRLLPVSASGFRITLNSIRTNFSMNFVFSSSPAGRGQIDPRFVSNPDCCHTGPIFPLPTALSSDILAVHSYPFPRLILLVHHVLSCTVPHVFYYYYEYVHLSYESPNCSTSIGRRCIVNTVVSTTL